jgi:hypothetical protein
MQLGTELLQKKVEMTEAQLLQSSHTDVHPDSGEGVQSQKYSS